MLDIDECSSNTHDCHQMAVCNNTEGSYDCSCQHGYNGDGNNCTGKFRIYQQKEIYLLLWQAFMKYMYLLSGSPVLLFRKRLSIYYLK